MSKHATHEMHENSLEAHREETESGRIGKRAASVYACYRNGSRLTDREVCTMLGLKDLGARPRITELIDDGFLEECGSIQDPITGRTVRIVRRVAKQRGLFA